LDCLFNLVGVLAEEITRSRKAHGYDLLFEGFDLTSEEILLVLLVEALSLLSGVLEVAIVL
jgi:hypothetical protein